MRRPVLLVLAALGIGSVTVALAGESRAVGERHLRRVLRQAFPATAADWLERLVPDRTMATCAAWNNQPPKEVADEIKQRERARIVYPSDGNPVGDWQRGETIAQSGYGLRFTDTTTGRENGGNCYACHQLAPDEVSFGTVGVSLKGYGRIHKFSAEDARVVYEKIYNSQAVVACSLMPRFGANGILTVEQIKDLVALLMHPDSPVNK
jgi:sulfur-oxidizing protein SoxX